MNFVIDGITIPSYSLSEWDGQPIKNHLPEELKTRLKTENQWMEIGYKLKAEATAYDLHPSFMAKKFFTYYLDKDVEPMKTEDIEINCLTCNFRSKNSYCFIAGGYVGRINKCSEWELKENFCISETDEKENRHE